MLGIRAQLLREPRVLVFLRSAASPLQGPRVSKPQQRAGAAATRESKAASRAEPLQHPRYRHRAPMGLKRCQALVVAVFFCPWPHERLPKNISATCCACRASTWRNTRSSGFVQCKATLILLAHNLIRLGRTESKYLRAIKPTGTLCIVLATETFLEFRAGICPSMQQANHVRRVKATR